MQLNAGRLPSSAAHGHRAGDAPCSRVLASHVQPAHRGAMPHAPLLAPVVAGSSSCSVSVRPAGVATLAVASNSTTAALPWQVAMSEVKKRRDIKKIMIIGAGPIVIGQVRRARVLLGRTLLGVLGGRPTGAPPNACPQACEFDYSGTQAVKALKCARCTARAAAKGIGLRRSEHTGPCLPLGPAARRAERFAPPPCSCSRRKEGYTVILLNSNPVRAARRSRPPSQPPTTLYATTRTRRCTARTAAMRSRPSARPLGPPAPPRAIDAGHHHDRPRHGRSHVHWPHDARVRRADSGQGESGGKGREGGTAGRASGSCALERMYSDSRWPPSPAHNLAGAPRRHPAHHGRPDGSQPGQGAVRGERASDRSAAACAGSAGARVRVWCAVADLAALPGGLRR